MSEVFEFVPGDPVLSDLSVPSPVLPFVPAEPPLKRRVKVRGTGLLRAMRHVMTNEDSRHDRSPMDRMARKWLAADLHKFMTKFESMESAELDRAGSVREDQEVPDLGHDAACKVLDRLLKEASR